jgi:carbamate kinase
LTTAEARKYLNEGHFPPGSMGPKIEAAIRFLEEDGGKRVVITSARRLGDAFRGKAGTIMTL